VQTTPFAVRGPYKYLSKLLHLLLEVRINICPNYSICCYRSLYTFVQTTPFAVRGPYKYLSKLLHFLLEVLINICPYYSICCWSFLYIFVQTTQCAVGCFYTFFSKLLHFIFVVLTSFFQIIQISVWGSYTHLSKLEEKRTRHFHFATEAWNLALSKLLHIIMEILKHVCPVSICYRWSTYRLFQTITVSWRSERYKLRRVITMTNTVTSCLLACINAPPPTLPTAHTPCIIIMAESRRLTNFYFVQQTRDFYVTHMFPSLFPLIICLLNYVVMVRCSQIDLDRFPVTLFVWDPIWLSV
jgi:hypothetical protein